MSGLFRKILDSGLPSGAVPVDITKTRLLNGISATILVLHVLYLPMIFFVGMYEILPLNITGFLVFTSIIISTRLGSHRLGRWVFCFSVPIFFAVASVVFGMSSALPYTLVVVAMFPFIYFDNLRQASFFSVYTGLLFFAVLFYLQYYPPISDFRSPPFFYANNFSIILVLVLFIIYFKIEYLRFKQLTDAQNKQLRETNLQLDRFAYVTAHDLKSPLRGIRNLLSFLQEDAPEIRNEKTEDYFRMLDGQARRMENLIEGILAYSRIDRLGEEEEWIDPDEVMQEIARLYSQRNEHRLEWPDDLPLIYIQPVKFQQVMMNLVGNAFRYHDKPQGLIRVSCRRLEDGLEFSVSDDGPGIPSEYYERIFEYFETLQPKSETGTAGVGLSIVRKIVEDKGGKVWLESELGKGTTFYFTIPGEYKPRLSGGEDKGS